MSTLQKVLLILTKDNYPSRDIFVNIVPQGLPYIASSLEKSGYTVYGMNPNYVKFDLDVKGFLKKILQKKIDEVKPDYIGLGGLSADYLYLKDTITFIREIDSSIPIILGGGILSSDSDFIFNDLKPDYGVILEGEITIVNLLNSLVTNSDLSQVRGIMYHSNKGSVTTESQMEAVDLDTLPYPNYDIFGIDTFYELSNQENMYFTGHTQLNPRVIVISGGRSCPFKCTFCYHSTGAKYKNRNVKDIIEEILHFYERYQFNIIHFYDELFSVNENRLIELCDALIDLKSSRNLSFDWICTMRVNQLKIPILNKMKESGCIFISFGFESASDIVLKSMKKKIKKAEIINAIKLCEEVEIGVQANFIFGDPQETLETERETVDFYNDYCIDHIVHNGLISPFPGSPIWDHCLEKNIITDRKKYYENIHKGNGHNNLMNMTTIVDKDFFIEIEEILKEDKSTFKVMKVTDLKNDKTLNIKGVCPHCAKDIEYRYPKVEEHNTMFSMVNAIDPFVNFCPQCHKRVVFHTITMYENFKLKFDIFLEKIQSISSQKKETVLILGDDIKHIETYIKTLKILENNGLSLLDLNIFSFLSFMKQENDNKVLAYPFTTFSDYTFIKNRSYLILPHDNQEKAIDYLIENDVSKGDIIYLDAFDNGQHI